mgnify:CR=1 FL=1
MMLDRHKNWAKHVLNIRNTILGLRLTTTMSCPTGTFSPAISR